MKRYAIATAATVAILIVGLVGCDQSKTEEATALARVSDDGPVLAVEPARLAGFFDGRPLGVPEGATPEFTVHFDTYTVEGKDENLYLIGRGKTSEGQCYIEARPLRVLANGLIGPLDEGGPFKQGPTHTCSGVNCSSCVFTYGEFGIDGCQCGVPEGGGGASYCNHTVTSG